MVHLPPPLMHERPHLPHAVSEALRHRPHLSPIIIHSPQNHPRIVSVAAICASLLLLVTAAVTVYNSAVRAPDAQNEALTEALLASGATIDWHWGGGPPDPADPAAAVPRGGEFQPGDLYVDTDNGDIYLRLEDGWSSEPVSSLDTNSQPIALEQPAAAQVDRAAIVGGGGVKLLILPPTTAHRGLKAPPDRPVRAAKQDYQELKASAAPAA